MRLLNGLLAAACALACLTLGYLCVDNVTLWPLWSWGRVGVALLGIVAYGASIFWMVAAAHLLTRR